MVKELTNNHIKFLLSLTNRWNQSGFDKYKNGLHDLNNVPDNQKSDYLIYTMASMAFKNCSNIKLSEKITNTLLNTDSINEFKHLPFPFVFLDTQIELEDHLINGILIIDYFQSSILKGVFKFPEDSGKFLYIHLSSIDKDNHTFFNSFSTQKQDLERGLYSADKSLEKTFNKKGLFYLSNFVNSFLNFLYFPEVQIIEEVTKKKSLQLLDKYPEMKKYYISITGQVRKYVNSFSQQISENIKKHNFVFPVRGFYRKLESDFFKHKRGQMIFVPPFFKGIGNTTSSKEYYLKEQSETKWLCQSRLFDIIKSLYPDQPILPNYRCALDGLEIDIYLPVLKLGFEYNGEQHYNFIPHFHKRFNDFEKLRGRDVKKNEIAKEKGIRLITVKYDVELTVGNIKQLIGHY